MTKVKLTDELYKLHILKLLTRQHGILDIAKPIDIDMLAARLSCDKLVLLEVLIAMGCDILE